ncbi:MAG: UDP-4-amino-4-deoxy-L-arabinose--oxoglutarate aminotransferase ArnB2 [Parcubacteria group bacterium Gr01-1014_70]|nr:MAG: UDP-4-amino-4-deoxy-L-arabinose--oxoglutarate aminotransferase ArnB2 [Parcubacteria group bacterium Gr01-1014_70]
MKVEFFKHNIDKSDIKSVEKILGTLFLSTGEEVMAFEKEFAGQFGKTFHARGVASCTAALHLALKAARVGEGDEVVTTPLSYVATAHAIEYTGARPVFVDVDPETGNMDIGRVEKAITKRTCVILPVHLYGQMVDMRHLFAIAKRCNVQLIEDAAHALEAARDGIQPGVLSQGACFSFYPTKSITAGEGGAFLSKNKKLADAVALLRHHGSSKSATSRYGQLYQHYDVPVLGWKYNMTNIQAALLRSQLPRVEKQWKRRKEIAERYADAFTKASIAFPQTEAGITHAHHLFTILVSPKKRDIILHELQKRGIGVGVHYRPIHLMSYYRKKYGYKPGDFPNAERIGASTISLPLYPKLTDREVRYVIDNVKEII